MSARDWRTIPAVGSRGDAVSASLLVPADWEPLDPTRFGAPAVVAGALEPVHGGFRANVVLTATPQDGLTFADWQNRSDAELPRLLHDYRLVDLEHVEVAGAPGGRRLAHHLVGDGTCVVMEQWSTVVDDVGWSLTWTVDVLRYDTLHDLFRAATDRLVVGPGPGEEPA